MKNAVGTFGGATGHKVRMMEGTFLIYLSVLFFISFIIILYSRAGIILLMLLPMSQMLGFLDPMAIAIKGRFDVHALIALILAFALLFSMDRFTDLWRASLLRPMIILGAFWLFGVIYPVWQGYSSLFYSLKASKEFLTIFSYFGVFLFLRTEKEVTWGWNLLLALGFYYSILEIAAQVLGGSLLGHLTYSYRKEAVIFWKVYPPCWPVILIALLHSYYESAFGVGRAYVRTALGGIGLLLTFFRSYVLAAIAVVPWMFLSAKQNVGKIFSGTFAFVGAVCFAVLIIGVVIETGVGDIEGLSDEFVLSGITEMATHSGGSLVGRDVFAKPRIKMVEKSPYIGYGFIDKDSKYGLALRSRIVGETLGFLDKGDVDVALKFGYWGRALFYGNAIYLIVILIRLARRELSPQLSVRCLTTASLLVIFLLVQPVHAPLSYSFGLLPLSTALGLIERETFLASVHNRKGESA